MLKLGIVGDGNDGIAPLTGCPVPVPTSKPDQYTPVTLLLLQHRPLGHPSSLHPTEPLTQRERERERVVPLPSHPCRPIRADIFTPYTRVRVIGEISRIVWGIGRGWIPHISGISISEAKLTPPKPQVDKFQFCFLSTISRGLLFCY